ncbi:DUF904 domain-containing protein [Pseudoalteromonas sp. McH1-7]|uniref:DUF904 domain-containing protein n=1 Tax=Pseudoalteromonas peptidolytica F12-50-A1 TaxID=1315280 RepID=A0A8I0T2K3_9GAMM|nr:MULTISPECIES: DUF904 domain-containing protein [Pseudoalteromonas]MBE0345075.1 hypothetical protein [Pseudoalteromonas peptidolytica F12-50-A1]MDW7550334.1 DUF904 domain-containing protein [Pseudoalteromonas peptidolytica]NLR14924.1 DUF904 domain-containing protein [Pseudoalteromonas peptidolytica]NUZ10760.1 DUF904 domain-containing protein [Pseudoalteromonas sp. McH1-7]RRS08936.1 DUF904 domain-containing protein [Pseudoalteromonas sp. J010]
MNNQDLQKLDQLIDQLLSQNNQLKLEVSALKEQNQKLIDENETLQLEMLESEEKQKEFSSSLSGLLDKLQTQQAS